MARTASLYGAYLFRDKDPAIDGIRTVIKDELGGLTRKHLATIEQNGGPVIATLDNWFNGKTMRPQNPSLEAAGRAIGFHRVWQKMSKADHEKILVQAARIGKQKEAAKEAAAKKRARKQNGKRK